MGGRASKIKGNNYEWALRKTLHIYGRCLRQPLSGALGGDLAGDLKWLFRNRNWKCQCKLKANGFKTDYAELVDHDILFKRADRMPTIVVMELAKFLEIIEAGDMIFNEDVA